MRSCPGDARGADAVGSPGAAMMPDLISIDINAGLQIQCVAISVQNAKKWFGGNHAVDDVSMDLLPNKVNLLIGPNGSGKTTLVNMISGLMPADGGKILFGGRDIAGLTPDAIFRLGIMRTFQNPRLFRNLSVLENLLLGHDSPGERFRTALLYSAWQNSEAESRRRAMEVLKTLGIEALKDSLAYDLSGGQIKLMEMGKTLMVSPKVIMLDEPIAGINPVLAHKIFGIITKLSKDITFLVIEHRLDIALKYADIVFALGRGSLIAQDSPEKILKNQKVVDAYL